MVLNMDLLNMFLSATVNRESVLQEKQKIIEQEPLEDEELDVFLKEAEEIRAEPELGGLGPGMFGEYTLYSFVVCRNEKRWVIKRRYSQFHTLDQQLLQAVKDAGGMEANLPEFPSKRLFGKMSPSFVRERQKELEVYLQAIVKDEELAKEPVVRIFLKLPMTSEQANKLEEAKTGDGLLTGYGGYKSLYQRTREEKARGTHHTQKKEMFAGPPTLAGASEVGAAFAATSKEDGKDSKKYIFSIPIVSQFGGQTVQDIFGGEVKGLHSTYGNQIKEQVKKAQAEKDVPVMTADGYICD